MAGALHAAIAPILTVGEDLASSLKAVEIARRYPSVYAAVGVHPHRADQFREESERLLTLLDDEKVVAVGEIGLDYFRNTVPPDVQRSAFREQLAWARARHLPVSIHNREAGRDVLGELRQGDRAVLHCFSDSRRMAEDALDLGCYLSFAGNLTFPAADELRRVAAQVPTERLLVESDAPVLAPQPRRGRRNEPAYVTITLDRLAALHDMDAATLGDRVAGNARDVFGWGSL